MNGTLIKLSDELAEIILCTAEKKVGSVKVIRVLHQIIMEIYAL